MSPTVIIATIALILIATGAGAWGILIALARLFRTPALTWRRALAMTIAWCILSLACGVLALVPSPAAFVTAGVLLFISLMIVLMRQVCQTGWWRAIAISVVFFVGSFAWAQAVKFAANATLLKAYKLATPSMEPTIAAGDMLIADRTRTPKRWDIIVFRSPLEPGGTWVFRAVGLPGETVEIVKGRVLINGAPTPTPPEVSGLDYDASMQVRGLSLGGTGNPMVLGPNEYYVLGDNTEQALDSRFWPASGQSQAGVLPAGNILGVVRAVYSPIRHARWFK